MHRKPPNSQEVRAQQHLLETFMYATKSTMNGSSVLWSSRCAVMEGLRSSAHQRWRSTLGTTWIGSQSSASSGLIRILMSQSGFCNSRWFFFIHTVSEVKMMFVPLSEIYIYIYVKQNPTISKNIFTGALYL